MLVLVNGEEKNIGVQIRNFDWQNEADKAMKVYDAENSSKFAELDESEKEEYWQIYSHEDFVEFPNDLLLNWLEERALIVNE